MARNPAPRLLTRKGRHAVAALIMVAVVVFLLVLTGRA